MRGQYTMGGTQVVAERLEGRPYQRGGSVSLRPSERPMYKGND